MNKETTRVIAILQEQSTRVSLRMALAEGNYQAAIERAKAAVNSPRQVALENRIAARWEFEAAANRRVINLLFKAEAAAAKEDTDVLHASTG